MATTNHYDLIVIGHDLAGLVAATLVAKRGKRVVLIPHGPVDGTYRLGREDLSLDTAPLLHLASPSVRQVYEELGMWTQLRRELRPVTELAHWVLPGARLDVEPGEHGCERELRRAWPGAPVVEAWDLRRRWAEATDEMLEEVLASDRAVTADGFWSRRFQARIAEQLPGPDIDPLQPLPPGHPLRATEGALAPWLQDLAPGQLGKGAYLRLLAHWRRGPIDRAGGLASLRKQLLQRFALKSGELKPGLRVGEVLMKRGRITGISLLGKRDRYGCDRMLIASDPRELIDGPLPAEILPRPLAVTLSGIAPVAYRYVLHLEIAERGLSPGLAGMVVCTPPESSAHDWRARHGAGMTYLRLDRPDRSGEDGVRRVSITRVVGHGEALANMRERILDELDRAGVLPFARAHIRSAHSPHDGRGATNGEGASLDDRYEGDTAVRLPMRPLYQSNDAPALGMGLLPHTSGLKNLMFASRLSLPGLGVEGEFAAGLAAANAISSPSRAGLSGLFLRGG